MGDKANWQWQGLRKFWQERWRRGGKSRQIGVLLISGGTALLLSATAALSYKIARGLILNNLKQNAFLEVQRGRDEIDRWLAIRKAQIDMLASSSIVQTVEWEQIKPYLKSEVDRLKEDFLGLTLILPDGSNFGTFMGRSSVNLKDRKYFREAMAGKHSISDPLLGRVSKVPLFVVASPIWSNSPDAKEVIGITSGNIKVDRLAQVVESLRYGSDSYAFSLNSKGVPIVHPNKSFRGTQEQPAPSFLEAKDANLANIARRMVGKYSGIELTFLDGKSVYVAYLPLNEAPWSIALVIPRSNLEKELHSLNLLAVVVAGVLVVAMLAALRLVLDSERDRARAEREALLNRLTGRIRASLEFEEILQTTVEEVGTLLHLERATFGWYDPEQEALEIWREYCQPHAAGDRWSVGRSSGQITLDSQRNSDVALPIRTQNEPLGYLVCSRAADRGWNREERELLQLVADQLAIGLTQSHLFSHANAQIKLLDFTLKKLQATQAQLVQSEKMSSLGQMVAGFAHEINNPVNFIFGNLTHAKDYVHSLLELVALYKQALPQVPSDIRQFEEDIELDFIEEDLPQILTSMRSGAERIRNIVLSLRNFSRLDEADKKTVDIHEGIDNTLVLIANRLDGEIQVVKNYSQLPLVECSASQINQVFLNLLNNAIDALNESDAPEKIIAIATSLSDNPEKPSIRIAIADSGTGIPDGIRDKIFDPFFTTKPVGKGTGLGLAICYQIVVDLHGGLLSVRTPPSGGAEFVVEIPLKSS